MSLRSSFLTMSQITEKSFTSHAMSQHHLEAWVSCDLTCSVTLLSVSHCATLKKPPTDFTHPEQFCSFNNPPIYRLHFNHFSPRYVKERHSHIAFIDCRSSYDITFPSTLQIPSLNRLSCVHHSVALKLL